MIADWSRRQRRESRRWVWVKDERGYLTRHTYDAATGARVQTIRDVDPGRRA